MNKLKRVPLRLTSLEALEPRTPLHAGPPPGMHFGDRGPETFEHGPRPEPRGEQEVVSMEFSGPQREARGAVFTNATILPVTFSLPETPPPTQVIIVITMPANTTLTFMPPAVGQVNSVVNPAARSSTMNLRLTSPQLTAPSLQNSASRAPATVKSANLNSLSSYSALLTASSVRSERTAGSDADDGEGNTSPTESTSSNKASADRISARTGPATQPAPETQAESDEVDDLIDLNPEGDREKAKRKGTRTAPTTSLLSSAREALLRRENQFNALSLSTEHLPNSQWQDDRPSSTLPANEDLIESLADDQSSINPGSNSTSSLAAMANTQLEATLGLATDVELLDEVASELAAAIAANSTTVGSLPAAEPK